MQFKKDGRWAIDFVGKRKYAAILSTLAVLSSLVIFFVVQPNWGIDFTGGTEIQVQTTPAADISDIRTTLSGLGLGSDAVQQVDGEDSGAFVIRIQDPEFGTEGMEEQVRSELSAAFGDAWIEDLAFDAQVRVTITVRYPTDQGVAITDVREALTDPRIELVEDGLDDTVVIKFVPTATNIQSLLQEGYAGSGEGRSLTVEDAQQVGPKVGGELRQQGFLAIVATLALILVYVAFRFELAFAPGAVLALFHDVTIVIGIFTLTGHEFNLSMIGALLTIIGYSLNDTIVIYDRIRENMSKYRRRDSERMINDSINETLSRTLATSFTTILAMSAFLLLGGAVIETFALAIIFGVIFGTYSTVFVASPTILLMEDLKPHLGRYFAPLASKAQQEAGDDEPGTASAAREAERESLKKAGPEG
jgi:preprotein translocase subunit SecF